MGLLLHRYLLAVFCASIFVPVYSSPVPAEEVAATTLTINGQLTTATVKSFSNVGTLGVTASPIPPAAQPTSTDASQQASPPSARPSNNNPIQSALSTFGDSYAAGMGTGITHDDRCRLGQFSYGAILAAGAPQGASWERRECSGATVHEVAAGSSGLSQLDNWVHVDSDLITVSIGGNDLRFSAIVDGCFLRIWRRASPNCQQALDKARSILSDGSLQIFIEITLVQIINKATHQSPKIFLTGYPSFFNVDTHSCDNTTFAFWQPERELGAPPCDKDYPCVTQEIRRTANDLTADVNRMLRAAVDRVRAEKGPLVQFIDPNPAFDGHRFCEIDNGVEVAEPKFDRFDTWFFLPFWKDNTLDNVFASTDELDDPRNVVTEIPPSSTVCDKPQDPEKYYLCQLAHVYEDPTNPDHAVVVEGLAKVQSGDFNPLEVPWYYPTAMIKAFHPRTLGSKAYADLIIEASG